MYRIVVADDEPLECLTIEQMLREYLGDSCDITLASSGREALEAVKRVQANIAVMDIEMPGINGLEVSRIIREEVRDCHIIFLTAYSEFEYVKQAIDMGADNYILKPCADAEIYSVLDRVISHIDIQQQAKETRSISSRMVQRLTDRLEEDIILNILGGYVPPEWLHDTLLELGIKFRGGVCMILRNPYQHSPISLRWIFNSSDRLGELRIIKCEYDDCLYVMVIGENEPDCVMEAYSQMEKILRQDKEQPQQDIYCALGSHFTQLDHAQKSFYLAHTMLAKCSGDRPICIYERTTNPAITDLDEFEDLLCCSLLGGDTQQALEHTLMLLDWLYAKQKDEQLLIYQLESHIKRALRKLKEKSAQELDDQLFTFFFEVGETKESRVEKLTRFISDLTDKIGGIKADKMSSVRKMIADYIQKRYKEDIFLEQIARDMNYSESYFSKLFKQCFDKNFVQYLTDVRIEAAKELLKNPKVNIKDVSTQVGYRDNSYFTKVFRRATGQSPSEYRIL